MRVNGLEGRQRRVERCGTGEEKGGGDEAKRGRERERVKERLKQNGDQPCAPRSLGFR